MTVNVVIGHSDECDAVGAGPVQHEGFDSLIRKEYNTTIYSSNQTYLYSSRNVAESG